MATSLNKVQLIGYLGDEVKLHHFEGGGCIARFPIATNESYTNKQTNEKVTTTEWHNIVVSNKFAEVCEKYLSKGDRVYVEGKLKTRKWQDNVGQDRYTTEVVSNEVIFLTIKNEREQNNGQQSSYQAPGVEPIGGEDDDLPF